MKFLPFMVVTAVAVQIHAAPINPEKKVNNTDISKTNIQTLPANNSKTGVSPHGIEGSQNMPSQGDDLLYLDNGTIKVGIDRAMGAAITWISTEAYPKNLVNVRDPGRLIQQSYYAGKSLDRTVEGQDKGWSPWTWNPIQGGGVSSWARVNEFKRLDDHTLYAETVPKLWDMPNEEAHALMHQWTGIEPFMPDVLVVRCEFISNRELNDRWGGALPRHQEVPACYFTRNFDLVKSYLGNGQWQTEPITSGPPWSKAHPPKKAMALFNADGQGIAVFSPCSTEHWNYGPADFGPGAHDDPKATPCMHVAPIALVKLGPKSTYSYRYWLVLGTEKEIAARLDILVKKYIAEESVLTSTQNAPGKATKD